MRTDQINLTGKEYDDCGNGCRPYGSQAGGGSVATTGGGVGASAVRLEIGVATWPVADAAVAGAALGTAPSCARPRGWQAAAVGGAAKATNTREAKLAGDGLVLGTKVTWLGLNLVSKEPIADTVPCGSCAGWLPAVRPGLRTSVRAMAIRPSGSVSAAAAAPFTIMGR